VVGVGSLRPTLHIMRVIQGKGFNGRASHMITHFPLKVAPAFFISDGNFCQDVKECFFTKFQIK
jgi:hypothetical protein